MVYTGVLLVFCAIFQLIGGQRIYGHIHGHHHNTQYQWSFHPISNINAEKESTLELVHVLFRHGERNPDADSLYPTNPYYNESNYPEGYGQLTNEGKRTEYNIGLALRRRYNHFLGPDWNIKYVEGRSSDYNRTKMSLLLVLAGLYPPRNDQVWSSLLWQPIPYNYVPRSQDKELFPFSGCNEKLMTMMKQLYVSPELAPYLERYSELFEILSAHTQRKMDIVQAFLLYVGFHIQEELGFPLEEWTKAVYPEPLHSAAVDMYYIMTNNTLFRRISTGYFLRKILADTKAKIDNVPSMKERRLYLYSGHEMNIATLLLSLDILKVSDVPPYGSYIIFELHRINNIPGLKLFYQDYKQNEPKPIKIPGCDYFCPYDDFYQLVEEILPESDADCYSAV
ncbi:hypothetical protein GWI33_006671 [Rhynchophorus ferrugineus]|uniref:acid phosphatase n=1 Tax=Rhynchophorus ferrugineus TaxID=354439 RepID=A0A834ILH0_RHYFE|nr:hypothetical protein GWI33_006671 [Rhynchophorus ferrugineus]